MRGSFFLLSTGKGGKNRRRGKNENEKEKRELVFKEDGQGQYLQPSTSDISCLPEYLAILMAPAKSGYREICFLSLHEMYSTSGRCFL